MRLAGPRAGSWVPPPWPLPCVLHSVCSFLRPRDPPGRLQAQGTARSPEHRAFPADRPLEWHVAPSLAAAVRAVWQAVPEPGPAGCCRARLSRRPVPVQLPAGVWDSFPGGRFLPAPAPHRAPGWMRRLSPAWARQCPEAEPGQSWAPSGRPRRVSPARTCQDGPRGCLLRSRAGTHHVGCSGGLSPCPSPAPADLWGPSTSRDKVQLQAQGGSQRRGCGGLRGGRTRQVPAVLLADGELGEPEVGVSGWQEVAPTWPGQDGHGHGAGTAGRG